MWGDVREAAYPSWCFFVFVLGWFFVVGLGFWLGCVFEGLVLSLGVLLCLVLSLRVVF